MAKNLKVIFFGTPDFAVPALKLLIENGYNISAVFTGKGPINTLAREHKIKVFQPVSLKPGSESSRNPEGVKLKDAGTSTTRKKDEQVFEEFKNLKPDICIVAAYGKIIPQKFLDIPKYGFLNIHPSLLPKYRGPSPIQTAILNGDKETGVSILVVDAEVDHGPILATKKQEIGDKDYKELEKDLAKIGAKLLLETLPKFVNGEIEVKPQEHEKATFTKMFQRDDGRINWNQPCNKIYNQIRALNPEPGTWTIWKPGSESSGSPEGVKLKDAGTSTTRKGKVINILNVTTRRVVSPQVAGLESEKPGIVVKINGNIAVAVKKCYLILKSIQLEGGKEMDAKSFVNGHPDFLNSTLE